MNSATNRKLWKFHGGVHPPFHKDESNQQPIKPASIPSTLVLPLKQHIGSIANATVKIGEQVYKGQIIASLNEEGLGANIHAPSSGTVTAIEERPLPHLSSLPDQCIVIETDAKDDWGDNKLKPISDFKNADSSTLVERIRQAGIVGLGGAVFPTEAKLKGSTINKINMLVINGAECEPYITCDDRLMRERSAEITIGIQIIQHILKPEKRLIAIEDNKPEAIKAMQNACTVNDSTIEVVSIPTIYPSGGEKQLIEVLTDKEVPKGNLPLDIGILSLNIGTIFSIYKAVIEGEPLISRIVTVTGNGVQHPQNMEVLIGTSFSYLAQQAGGITKMADHLIMGGPMMGYALEDDNIPIVKATNCALFVSTTALKESNPAFSNQPTLPCIRCGKCMEVCPVNLLPQQLYWHIRAKDFDKAQDHNLRDCIDCGCCSYVCPSHIPLVDYFRFGKTEILDQQQAKEKSDQARERHEFLLFRRERDKRERDEKRAAHKAALQKKKADTKNKGDNQSDNPKADAIKAAMERAKAKQQARAKSVLKEETK